MQFPNGCQKKCRLGFEMSGCQSLFAELSEQMYGVLDWHYMKGPATMSRCQAASAIAGVFNSMYVASQARRQRWTHSRCLRALDTVEKKDIRPAIAK